VTNALLTAAFLAGVAAVAYGAWLAWQPAGWLTGGVMLMLIPLVYARGSWLASSRG
jgi:hypothetical protein